MTSAPAILHPDILDAMAAAGWTFDMARAACRAAWQLAMRPQRAPAESRVSQESRDVAPVVSDSRDRSQESPADAGQSLSPKERKRLRDRIYVTNKRAAERAAKESLEPGDKSDSVAPLSLKKNLDLSFKERERVAPVANVASDKSAGRSPIPADWQPWPKNAAFAVAELGERGAANSTANFREHYEVEGTLMTEPQRQTRFRKWVRKDSDRRQGHLSLPIAGGKSDAAASPLSCELVIIRQGTPEAAAFEAHRGKPIPWGKTGTWAVKATEWQPEQRSESG